MYEIGDSVLFFLNHKPITGVIKEKHLLDNNEIIYIIEALTAKYEVHYFELNTNEIARKL